MFCRFLPTPLPLSLLPCGKLPLRNSPILFARSRPRLIFSDRLDGISLNDFIDFSIYLVGTRGGGEGGDAAVNSPPLGPARIQHGGAEAINRATAIFVFFFVFLSSFPVSIFIARPIPPPRCFVNHRSVFFFFAYYIYIRTYSVRTRTPIPRDSFLPSFVPLRRTTI